MSEITKCPHQYRRDVETCAICEAEGERDEARRAAMLCFGYLKTQATLDAKDLAGLLEAYPWLNDRPILRERAGR